MVVNQFSNANQLIAFVVVMCFSIKKLIFTPNSHYPPKEIRIFIFHRSRGVSVDVIKSLNKSIIIWKKMYPKFPSNFYEIEKLIADHFLFRIFYPNADYNNSISFINGFIEHFHNSYGYFKKKVYEL